MSCSADEAKSIPHRDLNSTVSGRASSKRASKRDTKVGITCLSSLGPREKIVAFRTFVFNNVVWLCSVNHYAGRLPVQASLEGPVDLLKQALEPHNHIIDARQDLL